MRKANAPVVSAADRTTELGITAKVVLTLIARGFLFRYLSSASVGY